MLTEQIQRFYMRRELGDLIAFCKLTACGPDLNADSADPKILHEEGTMIPNSFLQNLQRVDQT
jgi:hypothetical protein